MKGDMRGKKKLNGWREAYKCAFLNKTVCFGDHLCGGERMRDREEKGFMKHPGESVKNRQQHRQKQDAESIHLLTVRGEKKQTDRQRKDCWC